MGSMALAGARADGAQAPLRHRRRAVRYGELVLWRGLLPVLPGLAAFLVLFRAVLNPKDAAWLFAPSQITFDSATSQLGWSYFAQGPWSWPIGGNPHYGGNIANSLLFSDSVPAFSVPMKLAFQVLGVDGPTQVLGLGILLCLLLQSGLGFALVQAGGGTRVMALAGAGLFVLTPVLLRYWNIVSLFWQWQILAGLLIVVLDLSPRRRVCAWSALVWLSTGITPYVTVMLLALGTCDVLARGLQARSWRLPAGGVFAMLLATLVGLYVWGTLSISPGAAVVEPLGQYASIGLALIDPDRFSWFLRDLPGGTDSGHAYLGLGVLVLLLLAGGATLRQATVGRKGAGTGAPVQRRLEEAVRRRPAVAAIAVATTALAALSVLPTLVLGPVSVGLPVPGRFLDALSAFRANGRFMWPLMYAVILVAVLSARRVLPKAAGGLVLAAVVLQVADLGPLFQAVGADVRTATRGEPRAAAELAQVFTAPGVDAVEVIPAYPHPPEVPWREVGWAAHSADLPLRSLGYFNRYDTAAILAQREAQLATLTAGDLRPDTAYVVSRPLYDQYLAGLGHPAVARLDEWVVVRSSEAEGVSDAVLISEPAVRPTVGFGPRETDATGVHGWWLTGSTGRVDVTGRPSSTLRVTLSLVAPPCGPVRAMVAGQAVTMDRGARAAVELDVPVGPDGRGTVPVRASSASCTPAGDARTLHLLVYDPRAAVAGS
jgi:hypothetical protein